MAIDLFAAAATVPASPVARPAAGAGTTGTAAPDAGGFSAALGQLLDGVERQNASANEAVGHMLDKTGDVHDAMIALQRAELSLQFTVQIRNKLVQAYQDIMRMPL
jgi:flagellar hook-basal body complex protein FliE